MQILNAKKSSVIFKMDNGQVLQIAPGKVSSPFIGTKTLMLAVVNSGTPDEVGIIVSSSYELDMMRQVGASLAYLHNTERDAREKLLKDFNEEHRNVDTPAVDVDAAKYDQKIESLNNTIRDLTAQLEDAKSNKESDKLKDNLNVATEEISKLRSQLMEAGAKQDELTSTITDKEVEIKSLKDDIASLNVDLSEAKKSAHINVDELPVVVELRTQLKKVTDELEITRTNAENDTTELLAQVEKLTSDLEEAKGASAPKLTPEQVESINKYPQALAENQKLGEENVNLNLKVGRLESDLKSAQDSVNALTTENEQLKADGKQLVDAYNAQKVELEEAKNSYEKARAATIEIMEQFNIAYVDGKWVQTMNN